MRALIFVLLIACNKKSEPPPPQKPAEPKPDQFGMLSREDACCCITKDMPNGDIGVGDMTKTACAKQGGTCKTPWTDDCDTTYTSQKVANERNAADSQCPSGDRHDCDGDGFRAGEDKDDNDPKVH